MSSRGSGLSRWRAAYRIVTTARRPPLPAESASTAEPPPREPARMRVALIAGLVLLTGGIAFVGVRGYVNVERLIALSEEVDRSRVRLASIAEIVDRIRDRRDRPARLPADGTARVPRPLQVVARGDLRRDRRPAPAVCAARRGAAALGRIRAAAVEKFAEMVRTIELFDAGRRDDAVGLVRSDVGERLKREILGQVDEVSRLERGRLAGLRREAAGYADHTPSVLLLLLGGSLLVVLGLYDAVARENRRRRRTEGVLRESERRFRGGFEAAAVGMALVGPDGRLLKVNAALCEMLGRDEAELLTLDFQVITHPDDLEPDLALLLRALSGEIDAYQTGEALPPPRRPDDPRRPVGLARPRRGGPAAPLRLAGPGHHPAGPRRAGGRARAAVHRPDRRGRPVDPLRL